MRGILTFFASHPCAPTGKLGARGHDGPTKPAGTLLQMSQGPWAGPHIDGTTAHGVCPWWS